MCLCENSLIPVSLPISWLSQAMTPASSLLIDHANSSDLVSPQSSALESIRCNSFRQPLAQLHLQPTSCHCSCTALHFISSTVSSLFLWRADSALMSHTLLLCQISWLSLELHALSEGLMRVCLFMSACCLVLDPSGGDGSGCSLVVVGSTLVLCLFDGEEESPVVRSFVQPGITARREHVTIYHAGRREYVTVSSLQT